MTDLLGHKVKCKVTGSTKMKVNIRKDITPSGGIRQHP